MQGTVHFSRCRVKVRRRRQFLDYSQTLPTPLRTSGGVSGLWGRQLSARGVMESRRLRRPHTLTNWKRRDWQVAWSYAASGLGLRPEQTRGPRTELGIDLLGAMGAHRQRQDCLKALTDLESQGATV